VKDEKQMPTFAEVDRVLQQANALVGAAEAHGLLCGVICSGTKLQGQDGLQTIYSALDVDKTLDGNVILQLYHASCWQLRDIELSFAMLLPSDDEPLADRAYSLTTWCQGFLLGLGLAGVKVDAELSADVREALVHLTEIAKLDFEKLDVSEEDETAYIEVAEYVRMVVFSLYTEFSGGAISQTLH
jgi:uncharacterized protein